ncbi:hypothetical protein DM02DRAFT_375754 [Periconia macrospinosa]|uniref:Uncharacterized protein n=1 Tax=Periconia macrospinosa TaxID=97972 RepID=A0A2V1DS39_9PLEO|nr:hypothetical protein DM02DRAFT_375754 [Periconia macrospinosa]
MSDRAAPKGYPQRKPLPPSSLRNEVDESKIQVPDSQVAVSETQSTTLMRESEPPLSPKSRKILAKNVSKPVGETRPSIEFPSPFISRPKISNELDFTFSNRKILPKMTRNPGMVLEQQPSDVLPPFPYARSPLSYSEQNALEKKLPKNAVEDMNPDSGRPEAQQVIASSESAKLQQNEDLTPDPNVTSEQNSGGHAELTATPVNEGLENRPEPILTNHTIHSEQMAGSSGLSAPKAKKSRRRKRQQRPPDMDSGKSKHMNHENTESVAVKEGNHIIAVSTESARDLKPSASMPHESQDLVIIPPGDSGREISDGKRKEVLCSTGDSHKEVPTGKNPIEITLPSPMVGVTDLRDANNDFGDPESVEEQVQINHVEVADQRRDDPQPSFSGLNVSDMGELSGAGPAYRDRLSEIRRSPHGVPRIDNTHRVIKRRKHTRTDRASPVAAQANEALLSVSPKYMPLLEVFARVLQEGDEAREAVAANIKTHETAVAALQDAAEAKSSTISVLEARNKKFQGDIERLKTGFQRLQKFHEGMENDYSSLKRHAKLHQEQCDRTLQRRLEEIEKEKAEWMEDLEHTLDAVNQSRRSTKAVLDDCFVQLTIAESRKADIEKRLNEQNGLLEEEKKRRQDLEKKILPTIQTMFGSADRRLERLSRRMHGIQQAQEAASSDQTQREYREKTQDALKLLLKASSLTTGHAEAAEKTLQGIGEKIDTKLTEMANSIAKNHSSGTELRQSIADQLRDFRNDMFQCGEAAKNHRQLQEENEELHRKYKEQQDTCTNLEKEISNFQQTESDLISQRSQLEKRLDYSERMKLSQYAEISNMRDELRSVGSNLQTRVDELAIAEKQIREQADNLSEAKRLKEIQDRKILEQARVINEIKSVQS